MTNVPYLLILASGILVLGFSLYVLKRLGRDKPLHFIFKDIKRKLWMTVGLGGLFFSLYFSLVTLGASFIKQWGSELFLLAHRDPVLFVYAGLTVFAIFSLSIYLVRMLIKYCYLTKGRDS